MANKFEKGDVVVLKSGGPPMTVENEPVVTGGEYHTRWFKGASQNIGKFPEHLLEKYVAPAKK